MHSSLVNSHLILRMEPKTKMIIVNHIFLTNMHYVLYSGTQLILIVISKHAR